MMGIVLHESGVHVRDAAGEDATMWRGERRAGVRRAATVGHGEGVGSSEQWRKEAAAAGATADDGRAVGVVNAAMTGDRRGAAMMSVKAGSVVNRDRGR